MRERLLAVVGAACLVALALVQRYTGRARAAGQ